MSLFNNKSKNNSEPDVDLSDYERKLRERQAEYNHLNDILRGMRAEVSNLMDEIKLVTDNLVKKNAELFLLEESIGDLKRSYELLKQDIKFEEETFNKINGELIKIKNEINKNIPLYEKLSVVKSEYESVLHQLNLSKKELEKTKNAENMISNFTSKAQPENNLETSTVKKKKKCQAKTKTGSKCKRYILEGSLYCSFHSSSVDSN